MLDAEGRKIDVQSLLHSDFQVCDLTPGQRLARAPRYPVGREPAEDRIGADESLLHVRGERAYLVHELACIRQSQVARPRHLGCKSREDLLGRERANVFRSVEQTLRCPLTIKMPVARIDAQKATKRPAECLFSGCSGLFRGRLYRMVMVERCDLLMRATWGSVPIPQRMCTNQATPLLRHPDSLPLVGSYDRERRARLPFPIACSLPVCKRASCPRSLMIRALPLAHTYARRRDKVLAARDFALNARLCCRALPLMPPDGKSAALRLAQHVIVGRLAGFAGKAVAGDGHSPHRSMRPRRGCKRWLASRAAVWQNVTPGGAGVALSPARTRLDASRSRHILVRRPTKCWQAGTGLTAESEEE